MIRAARILVRSGGKVGFHLVSRVSRTLLRFQADDTGPRGACVRVCIPQRRREGKASNFVSYTSVIEICVTSPFPIYGNHNVVYQPVIVPAELRNASLRRVRIIGVHFGHLLSGPARGTPPSRFYVHTLFDRLMDGTFFLTRATD